MAALEEAGFRIFFSFLARDDLLRKRQFFAGRLHDAAVLREPTGSAVVIFCLANTEARSGMAAMIAPLRT